MDIESKDVSDTEVTQEAETMMQPESIQPLEDITSTEEGKNLAEEINIDQSLPSSEANGIAETLSLKEKQNGEISDSDTIPECDSDENIVIVMNETSKFNTRVKPDESAYTNFCNQCDAVFRWPYQLKNHISVAHEGKYPYNCKLCGKQFEHLKSFRDHKYVHTEERPYACELCPSRFKMRGGLNKHMRDIHIDTKVQFKCEYCSKTFKCKEKLINHFLVHTEEKAFACDICGKKFSRKTNMKEHRVTHSLEKDFECKECGMKFNRKYAMKIHMRNHLTVRPYKCEFCEKSFSQSHALKSHTRLHTGERPYKCQHCDRSFKQLGTLQVHTKRHLNEKNFKCGICDRAFIVQRRLNEHMRVHTGEKPYQCDFCPFRAATSTGLRCHKNTHERRLKRHMEEQESGNGPLVPKSIEEVIKQKMKPRLKPKIKPVTPNKDNVNNNNRDIDKSVDPSKVAVKKEITETTDNQKEEKAVKAPAKKKRSPAKKKFQAAAALAQMKNQSSSNNVNGNVRSLDAIVNKLKQSKSNVKQCFDAQSNSTRNIENIFVGGLNLCDMKDSKFTTIRETRMFADGVRRTIERKVRTSSLPNGNKVQKYAMSDRVVVLDSDSDSNSKDKTNHFRALNADPRLNYTHNQIAPMSSQPNRNINLAVSGKTKDEIYMEKVFANALLGSGDGRVSSSLDDKIMMQNLMNDNPNVINKAIENLANSITRAYYSDNEGRQPVSRSIPATITSNGGIKTEPGFDIQDLPIHDDNSSNEIHAGVKSGMNNKTFGELNTHMNSNEKQDNTKTFGELNTHMKTNAIQDNTKTFGELSTQMKTNEIQDNMRTFGELNTHMNMNVHLDSELNGADNNYYGNNHISITNKTIGVNNDVYSVVHLNGDSSTTDSNADNLEMNDPNSVSNDLNDVTYDVVQVCGSNT